MKRSPSMAERIRRGEAIPLPLAALLHAATPVVRAGMWRRLRQPRHAVDARVISFGNLTVGGTGKTPAVIERAQRETEAGHRVAILTRGYGSCKVPEPLLLDPGSPVEDIADCVGDEPALMRRLVPDACIVKAANRVAGARAAIDAGCDTLILDDGYQHVALDRDENVLLIDASNPFGSGHLLPRGILREPVAAMKRATAIILTHCDQAQNLDELVARIQAACPETPIRQTQHAPARLWRVCDGTSQPLENLRDAAVTAVCGIGNPDSFFRTTTDLGAEIAERLPFLDHAQIPASALGGGRMVVTTEKDAVRLGGAPENVWALGIELRDFAG